MKCRAGLATVITGALALSGAVLPGVAEAAPPDAHTAPARPDTGSAEDPGPVEKAEPVRAPRAAIVGTEPVTDRLQRVFVDSPAMHRTVQVLVLQPADRSKPRPTVYMLDGRSTQPDSNNWLDRGRAAEFYADKPVNVVFTVGGPASFYTDWQRPDPVLGVNKWETFLTEELPPLLDAAFSGNGRNAVIGTSMGAEAAMMLAIRKPELYSAIGAHSGCFSTGTDLGQAQARVVVSTYKGDPENMFGAPEDPAWLAHDVTLHASELRGKALYLSVGSGRPGVHDVLANPETPVSVLMGGPLEAATDFCTRRLAQRLDTLGIEYTANFRPQGTHSWPYWADELVTSWPTIAGGLGLN
ncbi:alpha/beta hydrolase [Nocardia sp. NPDC003345]